jgi:hypothetical protein
MTKPTLIILAAGMGSRYKGLKQLDTFGPSGETIMDYSVYDAIAAGFGEIVFIIKEDFIDSFKERADKRYGGKISCSYVTQELHMIPEGFELNPERIKPWGTGHATLLAESKISGSFGVINADDYYGNHSFKILADYLRKVEGESGEYSVVGFTLGNTLSESGAVSRGICTVSNSGYLTAIEEHHKIARVGEAIKAENSSGHSVTLDIGSTVSMNMLGFTPDIFEKGKILFRKFMQDRGSELKSEFYIPFMVNEVMQAGEGRCRVLTSPDKWFGVTYPEDKEHVRVCFKKLTDRGIYPTPLF